MTLTPSLRLQYNAALEEVTALKSDPWQEVISVNLLIHWTVALQCVKAYVMIRSDQGSSYAKVKFVVQLFY